MSPGGREGGGRARSAGGLEAREVGEGPLPEPSRSSLRTSAPGTWDP